MPRDPARAARDSLTKARREFDRWRCRRHRGVRIPEHLWRMAVEQAAVHGVHKASQALQLDYYCLQRRLMAAGAGAKRRVPAAARFVELTLPAAPRAAHCQLEVSDAKGGKVRVDVSGLSPLDLARFVRAVVGQEWGER